MAISYVAQAVTSSSPNAGMTLTLPTGSMTTGDLILIAAAVGDTVNNALAAPTEGGYTDVVGSTLYANDVNDINLNVFYKYWNGTDTTATFAAVGGTNASNVAVCMVFRGMATAAQGGPFNATSTTATGINSSNADPPSIATATDDAVVIVGATGHTGGATATYTNPTNYTTNAAMRAHNDTIDCLVGMGYRLSGYSNPEDPGVFTAATIGTAADNAWAAVTMALKVFSDAVAPTLSSPSSGTPSPYGCTGASVSTDEGNGTLYWVLVPDADAPSAAQVKAGQNSSGGAAVVSGNQAVSGTGTQNIATIGTAKPNTNYELVYMHEDAATNQSATSSVGLTTPKLPAVIFNNYQFVKVGDGFNTGERIR